MRSHHLIGVGVAGLLICLGWLFISPSSAEEATAAKPPTLADAAEGAYKATEARYSAGKATVEDIYRWSQRLMKAQQDDDHHPNAKLDHLARMANLHKKVAALYMTGSRGGDEADFYATKYFILEAGAEKSK